MADVTLDTGGSGSYTTFAAALAAISSPDDIIWVKSTSAEAITATAGYVNTVGTPAKPTRVISVDNFVDKNLTPGGGWNYTSAVNVLLAGFFKLNGIYHDYTGSSLTPGISLGSTSGVSTIDAEDCTFGTSSTSTSNANQPLRLGVISGNSSNDTYKNILKNCTVKFGHSNATIALGSGNHFIENLSITGVTPTNLFAATSSTGVCNLNLSDSDLSSWTISYLLKSATVGQSKIFLNRVKLHASTNLFDGSLPPHVEIQAINCHSGDTHIAYYYAGYAGTVLTDSTVYATTETMDDAGVSISRKMTTTSTAGRGAPLQTEFILHVDNDATITPYVELLVGADGAAALKTNECWIDVAAMTTDGTTIGTVYTTHPGILDAGTTDCVAGTLSYTGDGFTTERTHRISLPSSITVRQDSYVKITVNFAKPSSVLYVGTYGG